METTVITLKVLHREKIQMFAVWKNPDVLLDVAFRFSKARFIRLLLYLKPFSVRKRKYVPSQYSVQGYCLP